MITSGVLWIDFLEFTLRLTPPSCLELVPAGRKRRMEMLELDALFISSVHVCGVCVRAGPVVFLRVSGSSWDSNRRLRNFFLEPSWDDVGPGHSLGPIKDTVCLTKFGLVDGSMNQRSHHRVALIMASASFWKKIMTGEKFIKLKTWHFFCCRIGLYLCKMQKNALKQCQLFMLNCNKVTVGDFKGFWICRLFPAILLSLTQLRTADSSIQALFSFTDSDVFENVFLDSDL